MTTASVAAEEVVPVAAGINFTDLLGGTECSTTKKRRKIWLSEMEYIFSFAELKCLDLKYLLHVPPSTTTSIVSNINSFLHVTCEYVGNI